MAAGNLLNSTAIEDFTNTAAVDIIVEDINNNAPIFPRNYSIVIQENVMPGTWPPEYLCAKRWFIVFAWYVSRTRL